MEGVFKMKTLISLLSKKAQEELGNISDTELLHPTFIEITNCLSASDKQKLHIIRQSYMTYATHEIQTEPNIFGTSSVYHCAIKILTNRLQETLLVMFLDTKNKIIHTQELFKGGLNSSVAHPRDIFREAIKANACKIVVCHNHPSGDPDPSPADIEFTRRLIKTGNLIGIEVLDHVIIGASNYLSLREETNIFDLL